MFGIKRRRENIRNLEKFIEATKDHEVLCHQNLMKAKQETLVLEIQLVALKKESGYFDFLFK